MMNRRDENPIRQQLARELPHTSTRMRFFKAVSGPGMTAYPSASDNPTVYYGRILKDVSYTETVGSQSLSYTQTDNYDYFFNLATEDYIEEDSVVLCFELNRQWYTIDKVKASSLAILSVCGGTWVPPGGSLTTVPAVILYNTNTMEPVKWTASGLPDTDPFKGLSKLSIDNQGNYYSARLQHIYKYDNNLNVGWSYTNSSVGEITNMPQVDEQYNVYTFLDGQLRKYNSSGTEQWAIQTTDLKAGTSQWGADDFAITNDGFIYVTVNAFDMSLLRTEYLVKVDASDGSYVWDEEILTSVGTTRRVYGIATDADSNVYINTNVSPNLRAFDSNGNSLWNREFEPTVTQIPGTVYTFALCTSHDGTSLYAAGITAQTSNDTGDWAIKKINLSTQADVWEVALTDYLWPARMWTDYKGYLFAGCDKLDSQLATSFPSFRKYDSSGNLVASALSTARCEYMGLSLGRYPLFA